MDFIEKLFYSLKSRHHLDNLWFPGVKKYRKLKTKASSTFHPEQQRLPCENQRQACGRLAAQKVHYGSSQVQAQNKALLCWSKCHRIEKKIEKEAFKKRRFAHVSLQLQSSRRKMSRFIRKVQNIPECIDDAKWRNHLYLWFCLFSRRILDPNKKHSSARKCLEFVTYIRRRWSENRNMRGSN